MTTASVKYPDTHTHAHAHNIIIQDKGYYVLLMWLWGYLDQFNSAIITGGGNKQLDQ